MASWLRWGVAMLGGAALLGVVSAKGIAAGFASSGDYATATALAPDADHQSRRAQDLFFAGQHDAAIATARSALRIAPLNTRAIRTIGQAELARGHDDAGLDAMNAAARGGWRDNPTQIWTLQMALSDGDYDTAMERADALIRRYTIPDPVFAAFRAMNAEPGFRRSLIARLDDQPDWRGLMFLDLRRASASEIPPAIQLIADIDRTPRPVTDLELFPILERMTELGAADQAYRFWRSKAPRAGWNGDSQLYDGAFVVASKRQGMGSTPRFEWAVDPGGSGLASVEAAPNGQGVALRASTDTGDSVVLATQQLLLAPGMYRIGARIFARSERDMAGFEFMLRCVADKRDIPFADQRLQQLRLDQLRYSATLQVPAGCARQTLDIRARGGTPVGASVSFTDLALHRAA
jgi:tetratricopeptide (TPR) repeat protein